jgi:type III pantothenate kinase
MLLVVDVGNSHTVLGLYDGRELRGHWRVVTANYRTGDELQILLMMLLQSIEMHPREITGCCASSVVPQLNPALQQVARNAFKVEALMVEPGVRTGIMLQVDNPREVGADRIVNAVGAREDHQGPLIIIDFGTATTFDALTAKSEWIGGIIVPGIQLSADALFEHCAKLPRVDIVVPRTVIGRDTVTNIRAGLTYGYADMTDGLIRRMRAEMGGAAKAVATGGLAKTIAAVSKEIEVVDPLLTLRGLRAVFEKNNGAAA